MRIYISHWRTQFANAPAWRTSPSMHNARKRTTPFSRSASFAKWFCRFVKSITGGKPARSWIGADTMKRKTTEKAAATAPKRSKIIEQAVIYAQALAAYHAGFEVDPTGDSDYASKQRGVKSARKALEKLNSISPRKGLDKYESCLSADELQAKAKVLGVLY